jgi:hypothetical protein
MTDDAELTPLTEAYEHRAREYVRSRLNLGLTFAKLLDRHATIERGALFATVPAAALASVSDLATRRKHRPASRCDC